MSSSSLMATTSAAAMPSGSSLLEGSRSGEGGGSLMIFDIKQYILDKYIPSKLVELTLEVVYNDGNELSEKTHGPQCENLVFPFARSGVVALPIKEACILGDGEGVNDKIKRVLEIALETTQPLDYQPGDTIAILPRNSEEDVEKLLRAMKLEDKANYECQVKVSSSCMKKSAKVPPYIPHKTTPSDLLRFCLNLRGVLKKQFLRSLAECCTMAEDREFLSCLSSKEASIYYNELILERGLGLLEILQICASCEPTLALLTEHLPRLLPRPYSIANSPLSNANEIRIIFSILAKKTGVTTGMLEKLSNTLPKLSKVEIAPKVLIYLRDSNKFRYTEEDALNSNQILIGIGTGLSPFLGFLEHKYQLTTSEHLVLGETWLFAGAATEALHKERLEQLKKINILNRYFESLSRIPDAPFHYVQEQLVANSVEFVEFLLQPRTVLYICADGAQISKSIEAQILACLMLELNIQEADATQMVKDFRENGKYREDVWL